MLDRRRPSRRGDEMKTQSKWVLLGADTLAGREIRDLVEDRKLPVRLTCCGSASDQRVLSLEAEDNFDVFEELSAAAIEGARAVLVAGSAEQAGLARRLAREGGSSPVIIDAVGHFEGEENAVVRAPAYERDPSAVTSDRIQVVAHPASVALATAMTAMQAAHPLRSAVATVFEPASARGAVAVDEMHQQAICLFSFQTLPAKVFGVQASFNMMPRLGEEAETPLERGEARIRKHLGRLLAGREASAVSVKLVQAPVFSGYCASLWVEFESRPGVDEIRASLTAAGVQYWGDEDGPLSNTAMAGQSGILASSIAVDPDNPRAAWVWVACDNIRETALNAVALAGLAGRGA
jgi:aspartate-semialdehyde dehydrogenase